MSRDGIEVLRVDEGDILILGPVDDGLPQGMLGTLLRRCRKAKDILSLIPVELHNIRH